MKKFLLASGICILSFTLGSCALGSKTSQKSPREVSNLYVEMGTSALVREEYPQAVEDLRKALVLDSSNAVAHNHLGLAYFGLGKRDLAKASIQRAVTEDANYSDAYINLGNFAVEERNYTLAKHYFTKALTNLEYKQRHRAMTALGSLAITENRMEDAKRHLNESLAVNPEYCMTNFLIGTIHNREKNYAKAAEHFNRAVIDTCTKDPEAHFQLGMAHLRLKNYSKAKSEFVHLVESFPQSMQAQRVGEQLRYIP